MQTPRVKRKHLILVQAPTTAPDGHGGQSVSWATTIRWWAEITNVRGREEERLGRLATVETYLLVGRYDPRITTHHRAVWDGTVMNIRQAADRDGARTRMWVEAEVGVST